MVVVYVEGVLRASTTDGAGVALRFEKRIVLLDRDTVDLGQATVLSRAGRSGALARQAHSA